MAIAKMPGGGQGFNDDILKFVQWMGGILLILFFLLVIRSCMDQREGGEVLRQPVRDRGQIIRAVLDR